jgi:hypothetical protein
MILEHYSTNEVLVLEYNWEFARGERDFEGGSKLRFPDVFQSIQTRVEIVQKTWSFVRLMF